MRIWKEIRAVGFRDWCWFVLLLKRNEFSERLSLPYYVGPTELPRIMRNRQRAHRIDQVLSRLNRRAA